MIMPCNLSALHQAVNDYFYAEEEYQKFLKTCTPGDMEYKTGKERQDYTKYLERAQGAWNTIIMMCKLVGVDSNALIPIIKAINRWERNHGKWDRCFHWSSIRYSSDENFRKNISAIEDFFDDKHYLSTGRKIKA